MITITPLREADAAQYAIAIRQAIHDVPGFPAFARQAETRNNTAIKIRGRLKKKSYIQLIAKEGRQMVGFCYGTLYAGVGYIQWIGTLRGYRRRGIGKKLVKAFETAARKRKIHKSWLNTDVDNKASSRLFKSMGYKPVGIVKKHWYGTNNILWDKLIGKPRNGR